MTGYSYVDIFKNIFEPGSSTLVSDIYGLIWRILYVFYVELFCNFTVPLVSTVLSQMVPYMEFDICMQCF